MTDATRPWDIARLSQQPRWRSISRSTLLVVALFVGGCYSTITEHYSNELSKVHLGMSKPEFRSAVPSATVAGQNLVGGRSVEAYEMVHTHAKLGQGFQGIIQQKLWFYFYDGRLVKWGEPGSWPKAADLTVEVRKDTSERMGGE